MVFFGIIDVGVFIDDKRSINKTATGRNKFFEDGQRQTPLQTSV